MRQLIHRILSGTPMFGLAVLGLFATARPNQADKIFGEIQSILRVERNFWLCLLGILLYFCLWWISSIPAENKRGNLKKGLQPHYASTGESISSLKRVASDDDFTNLVFMIDAEQQAIVDWLSKNMGMPAVRKFLTVPGSSFVYDWPGNGGSQFAQKRSLYIDALGGRLANLQELMKNDSWDPPTVALVQRILSKFQTI